MDDIPLFCLGHGSPFPAACAAALADRLPRKRHSFSPMTLEHYCTLFSDLNRAPGPVWNGTTRKRAPRVPIGGGAWSGKDFFKADRAGGMHARRLAKFVVELSLAPEARVTLGWFPGDREARVLDVATPAGESISAGRVARCVDLTLARSGEQFLVADLVEVARWGHFEKGERPWEGMGRI